jgi:hypothetical protein
LARRKSADGFEAHQKSSESVLPPQIFEKSCPRFKSRRSEVVANIINDEFEIVLSGGFIE